MNHMVCVRMDSMTSSMVAAWSKQVTTTEASGAVVIIMDLAILVYKD